MIKNRLTGFEIDTNKMEKKRKRLSERELDRMLSISRAAAKLFEHKGYLATSIEDIAAKSGFSKGGIFYYFSSKNAILYFVLDNYMDMALATLERELAEIEGSSSKLKFIISRHVKFFCNYTSEVRTLLHEDHNLAPRYRKVVAEKKRKYYKTVAAIISDSRGRRLQKNELTAATFSLFGMCNWLYSWYNPKGSLTPEEVSEIIYEIFQRGFASESSTKRELL